MIYLRGCPQAGPAEQILYDLCKRLEGRLEHRRAHDENDIPSRSDPRIDEANRLARPAFRVIPVVGFSQLFACHETTACSFDSISCGIQNEQGMCPGLSITPHASELLWAAESLVTPHRRCGGRGKGRACPP